ncbi:hypothetical protein [Pseudomarimonas arenosa]|uniref:WGR domain-containing protein n=1 Tax=Pseudomarimonas arenosa TaxID=2774145 RepID=A0AAW3ZPI9_9GAMM|nr:hypothetical protein [Pseudomarimonas arenosa]MBD8527419.1 hypothetical protein [Pseudomarimonas arenosa]
MRGGSIFLVYGVHGGRPNDVYFGSFRTREDAEEAIARLHAKEMHGANWAAKHHDQGFVIRELVVETDFEVPQRPKPRDRFCAHAKEGSVGCAQVEVFERTPQGLEERARYARNHAMFETFEPFRQRGRNFALVSRDYTKSAVLDLATGEIVAEEPDNEWDFCPVGFYVPDWWDLHDDSVLPGSPYWSKDCELPDGTFGFVWGCVWGDDSSWKVQWLDLSRVAEGALTREERFGYVEVSTRDWHSPALSLEPPPSGGSAPPPFIGVRFNKGKARACIDVLVDFDLSTGQPVDWQRLRNENFD